MFLLFYYKIRETLSTVPPDRFIEASTTFESGIGRKTLKQLFREIPDILNLNEEEIRSKFNKLKMKGFGKAKIDVIAKGIPKFRNYLNTFNKTDVKKSIDNYIEKMKRLKSGDINRSINNKKFVLTGFMGVIDYELEDYIYDNGGDFLGVVTSDIEAVIAGNITDVNKKMTDALNFKIPVLTIKEFSERYRVPLKRFDEKSDKNLE